MRMMTCLICEEGRKRGHIFGCIGWRCRLQEREQEHIIKRPSRTTLDLMLIDGPTTVQPAARPPILSLFSFEALLCSLRALLVSLRSGGLSIPNSFRKSTTSLSSSSSQ